MRNGGTDPASRQVPIPESRRLFGVLSVNREVLSVSENQRDQSVFAGVPVRERQVRQTFSILVARLLTG